VIHVSFLLYFLPTFVSSKRIARPYTTVAYQHNVTFIVCGYGRGFDGNLKLNLKLSYDRQSAIQSLGLPSGAHDQIFVSFLTIASFVLWGALSDERKGL
jgi:hypothetical protein